MVLDITHGGFSIWWMMDVVMDIAYGGGYRDTGGYNSCWWTWT